MRLQSLAIDIGSDEHQAVVLPHSAQIPSSRNFSHPFCSLGYSRTSGLAEGMNAWQKAEQNASHSHETMTRQRNPLMQTPLEGQIMSLTDVLHWCLQISWRADWCTHSSQLFHSALTLVWANSTQLGWAIKWSILLEAFSSYRGPKCEMPLRQFLICEADEHS